MTTKMVSLNKWINKRMFFVVITAALAGFFLPMQKGSSMKDLSIFLFAYMTFVTSLGTSFKNFISVLKRPWAAVLALVLVHIGSPLLAWAVGWLFYPQDPMMRLGFLVASAIPIAVTSIMWTDIAGGDVAVSIMAVTLDTFVVPLILPTFFLLVTRQAVLIDYGQMVLQLLLMVTFPSLAGMLLHDYTEGRFDSFSQSIGGITSKIALFFVIYLNASLVFPMVTWSWATLKTLAIVLALVVSGYLLGYLGSFLVKDRTYVTVPALIYNVGMRNNSFGLVLALSYFTPAVAIPMTLSIFFQQPVAAIVSHFLTRHKDDCLIKST